MDKRDLLNSIRENLDLNALLKSNPGLSNKDVEEFFQKIQKSLSITDDNPKNKTTGLTLHIDGAARGNPGPAAVGCVLTGSNGEVIEKKGKVIGKATNNVAEYQALLYGLDLALDYSPGLLEIFSDSELLVKQMTGIYKTKNSKLAELKQQSMKKLQKFSNYSFTAIPREKNVTADFLANEALDNAQ